MLILCFVNQDLFKTPSASHQTMYLLFDKVIKH